MSGGPPSTADRSTVVTVRLAGFGKLPSRSWRARARTRGRRRRLEKMASDAEPAVAADVRWSLATPVTDKDVQGLLEQMR